TFIIRYKALTPSEGDIQAENICLSFFRLSLKITACSGFSKSSKSKIINPEGSLMWSLERLVKVALKVTAGNVDFISFLLSESCSLLNLCIIVFELPFPILSRKKVTSLVNDGFVDFTVLNKFTFIFN